MPKSIYVGNLPFNATEDEVRSLFEAHGNVLSVKLISDRETGRPRGFGFVEMDGPDAAAAISALDGADMNGRSLRVNEAMDRGAGPAAGAAAPPRGAVAAPAASELSATEREAHRIESISSRKKERPVI